MNRFEVVRFEGGILLVDLVTGEVRRVPWDGPASEVLAPEVLPSDTRPGNLLAPVIARAEPPKPPDPLLAIAGSDVLSQDVVTAYPYPVAWAWQRFLTETDARVKRWALVDAFSCALKTWSFFAVSLYLRSGLRDEAADELVVTGMRRPLLSVWQLALDRMLPLLRDAGGLSFAPEADAAWRALTREQVVVRGANAKLSPVLALLRFRNEMAHGLMSDVARARDEVEEYEPIVRRLLEAESFAARFVLHRAVGHDGSRIRTERWAGAREPSPSESLGARDADVTQGSFFLRGGGDADVVPLLELVSVAAPGLSGASGPAIGLFEGYGKRSCVYVSLGGERWDSEAERPRWGKRLRDRAARSPGVALAALSLDAVRAATERASRAQLDALSESGAGIPAAAFQRRSALDARMAQLDTSDLRGMLVAGEVGCGKSLWLADQARRAANEGDVVLFHRAAALVDADWNRRIVRDLGVREEFLEDVVARVCELLPEGAKLRIHLDGVDQFPGDVAALLRHVDALVAQLTPHANARVVVTMREGTYRRLPAASRLGRQAGARYLRGESVDALGQAGTDYVSLAPFDLAELPAVYERYRGTTDGESGTSATSRPFRARPTTPFTELRPDGSTVAMMREPLLLRMILETHHGRRIRSDLSVPEVMQEYVRRVVLPEDAGFALEPRRSFLRELTRAFDEAGRDALPLSALYDDPALRANALNPERDSPFVQLLDLGVLEAVYDESDARVRFSSDRFLAHFLAARHVAALESTAEILALARRATGFASLRGVLVGLLHGAVRDEREACVAVLARSASELSGKGDEAVVAVVTEAIATLLGQLGQLEARALPGVLASLESAPSAVAHAAMHAAFEWCMRRGELVGAELLASASEASALDALARSESLLAKSRLFAHRGKRAEALVAAEAALAVVPADAPARAHEIDLHRAHLLNLLARLDEAEAVLSGLAARIEARGSLRDAARARLVEGAIAGARMQPELRIGCDEQALALARRAGDEDLEGRARNNLAVACLAAGRIEDAATHLEAALALKRRLGDPKPLATSLLNVATFQLDFGEGAARASGLFAEALAMFERIGFATGVHAARANLVLTDLHARGDAAAAVRAFEALLKADPAPFIAAEVHGFRAMAALDVDDLEVVRASHAALAKLGGAGAAPWIDAIDLALHARSGSLDELRHVLTRVRSARRNGKTPEPIFKLPLASLVDAIRRFEREGLAAEAEAVRAHAADLLRGRAHPRAADLRDTT